MPIYSFGSLKFFPHLKSVLYNTDLKHDSKMQTFSNDVKVFQIITKCLYSIVYVVFIIC